MPWPAVPGVPGPHELLFFMAAVFVLNATPGVDLLLTVTRTLQGGARAGATAALGINAGCVLHALAAAFGLAALLAVSATAFTALRWAGAAYLLWLGVGLLRRASRPVPSPAVAGTGAGAAARPAWTDFRIGLLTNVLNPKVALFFLAFLPQFIAPQAAHTTAAFLALGALFVVQSTLFLLVVVALSARLRALPASPRWTRGLQAAGGLLFVGLAVRLLRPAS